MHVHVAEQCVQQRKNMVTASYISAGQQLHERSGPMSEGAVGPGWVWDVRAGGGQVSDCGRVGLDREETRPDSHPFFVLLTRSHSAKAAGVTLLNEIGLDPGIDHLSAMQMIDDAHRSGGKVVSFQSLCGGLPAPEAANNPLQYKFSWSPRGVLSAGMNSSRYLKDGKVRPAPSSCIAHTVSPLNAVRSPPLSLFRLSRPSAGICLSTPSL